MMELASFDGGDQRKIAWPESGGNRLEEDTTRRFGISDLMIFVAATALAFAAMRPRFDRRHFYFPKELSGRWQPYFLCACILAFFWSMAVVVASLRQPRMKWPALVCQPGVQACAAVLIVALFRTCWTLTQRWSFFFWYKLIAPEDYQDAAAVAVAWLFLAASRRWTKPSGWLDRVGRCVGWYWISLYGALLVIQILVYYS